MFALSRPQPFKSTFQLHPKRVLALASLLACGGCFAAASASASVIVSPLQGSAEAMPATQISFLGASAGSLHSISVVGSRSGRHSGVLRPYRAATGASFVPSKAFQAGETVSVSAIWHQPQGASLAIGTRFSVARPATLSYESFAPTPGTPADVQSFHSQPGLHPPLVTVHLAAGPQSAPGYLFAAPYQGPGQWGPMIFDSAGNLVWFHRESNGYDAANLRVQALGGQRDLTWWQGRTVSFGFGLGYDVIANPAYRTVAIVTAGNGLLADEHEFTITPHGIAYLDADSPVRANLSSVGGSASGIVLDNVIQEIDIRTGLVMWEWHSLGHISPAESYSAASHSASSPYDYFHLNSIEAGPGGNLLVSARNTSAVYEIEQQSGAVLWRLGGKRSSFSLGPGVAFAYQHDAGWLANGDISLFDDEGSPAVKPPSRGEVVHVEAATGTATLVSQLVRSPESLSTASQGNLQALPAGWLIGWGGLPNFTEFNAQGEVIYDAQLPAGEQSYRVYRLPWAAQPATPPALAVQRSGAKVSAYASWNGATTVAAWQLLAGAGASRLSVVATVPRDGFETSIAAPVASFYAVRAISSSGRVIGSSRAIRPS